MKFKWTYSRAASLKGAAVIAAVLLSAPALGADGPTGSSAAPPGATDPVPELTESQREARALLKAMADHLAGLQSFTVNFRDGYDVVQATGQKIEFGETRRITLARPNQLRVEEIASDGRLDLALFDGKDITVFNADTNLFARAPQPGSVDDALVYFVRDLRMRMPLARLLTTRLPTEWPKRVKTVDYVESVDIAGVRTHHVAGRTDAVDFQYWIKDGPSPLPLRVVLTYSGEPGQPQFWANFSDWNTSPRLPETTFQFTPPAGARQIAFATQVSESAGARQPAAPREEVKP
jgi:hypothetical protein